MEFYGGGDVKKKIKIIYKQGGHVLLISLTYAFDASDVLFNSGAYRHAGVCCV